MSRVIEVIVARCKRSELDPTAWTTTIDPWIHHSPHTDPIEARELAKKLRGKGRCVILRPKFNEGTPEVQYFREWRSFDGGKFSECRWYMTGGVDCHREVEDDQIEVPSIPHEDDNG